MSRRPLPVVTRRWMTIAFVLLLVIALLVTQLR